MKIPKINEIELSGRKVLVRADLDVGNKVSDTFRLRTIIPTLKFLKDKDCEIVIIGHKGRPKGKVVKKLSLEPIGKRLEIMLMEEWGRDEVKKLKMNMMENLRFDKGEEENDEHYTSHLAENGEVYINEAFSNSHREHASIVGLPKILPHAAGFRFLEEVENLTKVFSAEKPLVSIIGGVKEDKIQYIEGLKELSDKVLVAGRLPEYLPEDINDPKLLIAKLTPDKEDITIHSIEKIIDGIVGAKTIIVAGPMGKFEEEGHRMGTERVYNAVAKSSAFKIACGGDSVSALQELNLLDKFDWVSVGGGASLEFITKETLPGIEALLQS